jgi:hypothetical protein
MSGADLATANQRIAKLAQVNKLRDKQNHQPGHLMVTRCQAIAEPKRPPHKTTTQATGRGQQAQAAHPKKI